MCPHERLFGCEQLSRGRRTRAEEKKEGGGAKTCSTSFRHRVCPPVISDHGIASLDVSEVPSWPPSAILVPRPLVVHKMSRLVIAGDSRSNALRWRAPISTHKSEVPFRINLG